MIAAALALLLAWQDPPVPPEAENALENLRDRLKPDPNEPPFPPAKQDPLAEHEKTLKDTSYGNYWDRADACKGLGKLNTLKAAELLLQYAADGDDTIQEAVVIALSKMSADEVRAGVVKALPNLKSDVARANLIWAFRRGKWADAKDAVAKLAKDASPRVRLEVARSLDAFDDASVAGLIGDSSPDVAEAALFACARQMLIVSPKELAEARKSPNPRVRAAAVHVPGADLASAAKDVAYEVRIAAVEAGGPEHALDTCSTTLEDKEWRVRAASIEALEEAWQKGSIDLLIERLQKEEGRLVLDIVQSLERLTGKQIGFKPEDWKTWWAGAREKFDMPKKAKRGAKEPAAGDTTKAKFFNVPLFSKRLVFVIDCSGSMKNDDELYKGKRKIDVAMEELEKAVAALEPDAKFNVIMLSTQATALKVRSLSPRLVPAGEGNRKKAMELVKSAWAKLENEKRGRGDIYDAVVEACADPEADTVLLLSDGKPTDGQFIDRAHILEALAARHRYGRVAVHAILTGSKGIDEDTMRGIADTTRGLYMPRK